MKLFIPGAGAKVNHILNFREIRGVDKVIISDIYPWAYGNFVADSAYQLPLFEDPDFFPQFEKLLEQEKFDVCLPLHDASLYLFYNNRERMEQYPFTLAMNEQRTCEVIVDKLATYEFFMTNGIPTARMHRLDLFIQLKTRQYPCFLKPRLIHMRGTAKQLYLKLEDDDDLEYVLKRIKGREDGYVVQEFLDGTEVNIDFFCDDLGVVKSIVPLERQGMGLNRGISRGKIRIDDRFTPYVLKIAEKLKFWGANQIQCYLDDHGNLAFTEINGRFSGSSVFVKEAGVNFFHYFVRLLRGEPIEIRETPAR